MSELLERELSRVLHDLPGEPGVQPTLYTDVQGRARRLRRRRYGSAVAAVVVAVLVAVLVPGALFNRSNHGRPRPPAGGSDITTWPARGSLVSDFALRQAAVTTWQSALTVAHRG